MSMNTRPFPFRPVLAGELRGVTTEDLIEQAGPPDDRNGEVWIYRFGREQNLDVLSDPRTVVVQFWIVEGLVANCHLHLHFADGMKYDEIIW